MDYAKQIRTSAAVQIDMKELICGGINISTINDVITRILNILKLAHRRLNDRSSSPVNQYPNAQTTRTSYAVMTNRV